VIGFLLQFNLQPVSVRLDEIESFISQTARNKLLDPEPDNDRPDGIKTLAN
jgi:hypothetical protein